MKRKLMLLIVLILMISMLPAGIALADTVYIVQPGDNLTRIAARFNTTVQTIQIANGLTNTVILVGQTLIIPDAVAPPASTASTYIVQAGDNLFRIALNHGVTVEALKQANNLDTNIIYVGQVLRIPDDSNSQADPGSPDSSSSGGTATPTSSDGTYTVKPGDNLYRIAINNDTTVQAIIQANNLTSTIIYVGQVLQLSGDPAAPEPAATSAPTPDTSTSSAPPVVAPSVSSGFELGGQVAGFGNEAEAAMRSAGMNWVKRQVVWRPGASANDHMNLIADAHARGFKILLSVRGHPNDVSPSSFAEIARFMAQLAAGGAEAIEVWNEQNIDREWPAGQISPATYTSLLQQAYNAIKAASPGTMVVSGAPAPTGFFGGCGLNGCDDAAFIAGMAAAGALNYVDCIGIHYNEGIVSPTQSSGDPRGNSGHYTRYYQTMIDTYYNLTGGQRQLCLTEIGYLSGEEWGGLPAGFVWRPPYNLTVAEHAQYLGEAVWLSRSQGKVRLMIVFNVDFTVWGSDPQAGFAMIRPGGGCPSCATMAAAMQ